MLKVYILFAIDTIMLSTEAVSIVCVLMHLCTIMVVTEAVLTFQNTQKIKEAF